MARVAKRAESSERRGADLVLRNWRNNDCEEELCNSFQHNTITSVTIFFLPLMCRTLRFYRTVHVHTWSMLWLHYSLFNKPYELILNHGFWTEGPCPHLFPGQDCALLTNKDCCVSHPVCKGNKTVVLSGIRCTLLKQGSHRFPKRNHLWDFILSFS